MTIPRELRQHTLEYAFADMMEKDLKFNADLWYAALLILIDLKCVRDDTRASEWRSMLGETWATHTNSLASSLATALPHIVDDVMYVLENTLTDFEKENEEERKLDREVTIYQRWPEALAGWRKIRSEVRLALIAGRDCYVLLNSGAEALDQLGTEGYGFKAWLASHRNTPWAMGIGHW